MNDSEYICPVPKDQSPLNEYKKLKESNNFVWCIQDKDSYFQVFVLYWLRLFFFHLWFLLLSSFSLIISIFSSYLLFSPE